MELESIITEEDLDLIQKAVRFFVESSGYYISYNEKVDLRIKARATLKKMGLIL